MPGWLEGNVLVFPGGGGQAPGGGLRLQRHGALLALVLEQLLHPSVGLRQQLLATLDETDALLEFGQRVLEAELPRLQLLHDVLEALHHLAVGLCLLRAACHGYHLPYPLEGLPSYRRAPAARKLPPPPYGCGPTAASRRATQPPSVYFKRPRPRHLERLVEQRLDSLQEPHAVRHSGMGL